MRKNISLLVMFQLFIACNYFAAGSYPFAEIYKVKADEAKVIAAVEQFKKENPDYNVPPEVGMADGRSNRKDDHWYHVYFYYKKDNEIVNSWLRSSREEGTTSFALVAINQGLEIGNWKEVNNDLSGEEDDFQKEKFKKQVVDKIIVILNRAN